MKNSNLKIEIDKKSGFCFGVVYAIQKAEDELKKNSKLYCIGDIVHNSAEVERLEKKGLITINQEEFKKIKNSKVLIRAHGEPPETYKIALKNNIELIDASCPVVLKLQTLIKKGFHEEEKNNGQLVIFGKKGHAEVNGLLGQTKGKAIVVSSREDLKKINFRKSTSIFSQTTKSIKSYSDISKEIKNKLDLYKKKIKINNTICGQVSNRDKQIKEFAKKYDIIIFVSGKKSSNGKMLYNVCKNENKETYFISEIKEIKKKWFENKNRIGICGATSTPFWLMQKIVKGIKLKIF